MKNSKKNNIGIMVGLTVLGLLVGGGISAWIIHTVKPLDRESASPSTYIKKSELTSDGLYKATGSGEALVLGDNVKNKYTLNSEISVKSILKSTLTNEGLYKATGSGDDLTLGTDVSKQYIEKSSLNDNYVYTGKTAQPGSLSLPVVTDFYFKKSDYDAGKIYEPSEGTGVTKTLSDVSSNYIKKSSLNDNYVYTGEAAQQPGSLSLPVVKVSYLKKEDFTDGRLYKATGTGDDLVLKDVSLSNFPVVLVTDGGVVNDKSFNEEGYEAVKDLYYGELGGSKRERASTNIYVQPSGTGVTNIVSAYNTAVNVLNKEGTRVIIAPGFFHAEAIKDYQAANPNSDVNFVLLDIEASHGDFSGATPVFTPLKNTYAIQFDTKSAGFQAGYLAGLYLENQNDTTPRVGTWGGGEFEAVTDFMVGFVAGIKYYNDNNAATKPDVKFVPFATDADYVNSGFEPNKGRTKADTLVAGGADIILPVAGPQTADALASINVSSRKDEIKVIGVDNDQSKSYPEDASLFLTSIRKNVRRASFFGYKAIEQGVAESLSNPLGAGTEKPDGSREFKVGLEGGFTGYVRQYKTSAFTTMYKTIDAITPASINTQTVTGTTTLTAATWENALTYIKANVVTAS